LGGLRELAEIGTPEVVPYLLEGLEDEDSDVRWDASMILGRRMETSAAKGLINRLDDWEIYSLIYGSGNYICVAAAWALQQIGTQETIAAIERWEQQLIEYLKTGDYFECYGPIQVVGDRKYEPAVPYIIEILTHKTRRLAEEYYAEDPNIALPDELEEWLVGICLDSLREIGTPEAMAGVRAWEATHNQ